MIRNGGRCAGTNSKQTVLIGLRMNRGVRVETIERALHCSLTEEERERMSILSVTAFYP